jgi:hypothetical protein
MVAMGIVALVALPGAVGAGVLLIPNASFESPFVANAPPYATSDITDWQKAPVPSYFYGLFVQGPTESAGDFQARVAAQWTNTAGVFLNVGATPIDNVDLRQGAFVFSSPGVELFQDLDAKFVVGQSYHLTVGLEGGGYGMALGVPISLRLYYRDAGILSGDNRIPIGTTTATNTNITGSLTHLTDYSVDLPAVQAGDPFAGKNIGVQILSPYDPAVTGGYWDVDNVRLTSVPEPASLAVLALGAAALCARRRVKNRAK